MRSLSLFLSVVFVAGILGLGGGAAGAAAQPACQSPSLAITPHSTYWASYPDFQERLLTVEITFSNSGSGEALTVNVERNSSTGGAVIATTLPAAVAASIAPGGSQDVSFRFRVPAGTIVFRTAFFLSASDGCGGTYQFPSEAGPGPSQGGCTIFPSDNIWNTRVDSLPVDASSSLYIQTIGQDAYFHADFGSGLWDGGPIGIPLTEVTAGQELVPVSFEYADESDPGPYPVPPDAAIEGGSGSSGDRHVLILDDSGCTLYELYHAFPQEDGSWQAGSGAVFDMNANALRPEGWTSADAAGLPIFPGLVRYDEVAAGEIRHAIRFTAPETRRAYVWPARHFASYLTGAAYPPMGQRFRLKADYDISGYSPEVQVVLTAMKRYGIILADNGAPWYITGAPDERWDNDHLHELHQLHGSDFEAVDVSSLMLDPDSGQAAAP